MIPYRSHLATLVPTTGAPRFEIIKAINTLAARDQEQRLGLQRAQLASLRREFEGIARHLHKLCRDWPPLIRSELRKAGFNATEPRVPAGHPDGGQWTGDSGAAASGTESFPMHPTAAGYLAPNTPPTATIGFQELSTESICFSRKPKGSLKRPPLDRSPMTALIGGPLSIGITMRPSMRPSPPI